MTTTTGKPKVPCTLIRGDGIGPEIVDAVLTVLAALGDHFDWSEQLGGMAAVDRAGDPLPDETLADIRRTRLVLKGPLTTPIGSGYRSVNVRLREAFDLYANVRPGRSLLPDGKFTDIDLVLIRENTGGFYVGVEHFIPIGDDPRAVAEASGILTRVNCTRIARFAFEYALKTGRRKITVVHKANPTALLLAAAMLLDHCARYDEARRLRDALCRVLADTRTRTVDLGGPLSTAAFTAAVIGAL